MSILGFKQYRVAFRFLILLTAFLLSFVPNKTVALSSLDAVEGLIRTGDYDEARSLLKETNKNLSQSEEVHRIYLAALLETDMKESEHLLRAAAYQRGDNPWQDDALYELGHLCLLLERPEAAALSFEEILLHHRGSPYYQEASYWLGNSYYRLRKYEEARETYRRLLESLPPHEEIIAAWTRAGIADAYYHEKSYEAALESYREVLVIHPQSAIEPWIHLQAARSLEHLNRRKEADMFYEYLLRTYPRSPEASLAQAERPDMIVSPNLAVRPSRQENIPPSLSTGTVKSSGDYTVQAGAFRDDSSARLHASRLSRMGLEASVIYERGLYKVRVGQFATLNEAQAFVEVLSGSGISSFALKKP